MANYLLFQKIIAVRLKKVYGLLIINIFFILKNSLLLLLCKSDCTNGLLCIYVIIISIGLEMKAGFFHISKYKVVSR